MHADKILLNKTDLLQDKDKKISHIKECISKVNFHGEVVETQFAVVDLDFLLKKNENGKQTPAVYVEHSHALSHKILDEVESVYLNFENDLRINKKKLEILIGELLWESTDFHVMRCKGVFQDTDGTCHLL